MTRYRITVHERTYTTPVDPDPHPVYIDRTIVDRQSDGPCLTPVTVRSGTATATIPCGRSMPRTRQCANCRIELVVVARTTEHLGYLGVYQLTLD